jgi:lysophospholipase L1-like esterase
MRLILFIVVVIIIIAIAWFTGVFRTLKTVWLIMEVKPYEQVGAGEKPPTIFVLGDSTGYGTGAGKKQFSVAGLLGADYPNYKITNNSKNGRTIGEALVEIKKLPTESKYTLLLLQIGGNDILQKRDLDVVRNELLQLYQETKKRSDSVVMISSGNVGTAAAFTGTKKAGEYERITRQFRQMFIEVAGESEVTYVDLFQEPEDDVFLKEPKKYLAIDGLHPSAQGYAYWYETLAPIVSGLLHVNQSEGMIEKTQ